MVEHRGVFARSFENSPSPARDEKSRQRDGTRGARAQIEESQARVGRTRLESTHKKTGLQGSRRFLLRHLGRQDRSQRLARHVCGTAEARSRSGRTRRGAECRNLQLGRRHTSRRGGARRRVGDRQQQSQRRTIPDGPLLPSRLRRRRVRFCHRVGRHQNPPRELSQCAGDARTIPLPCGEGSLGRQRWKYLSDHPSRGGTR